MTKRKETIDKQKRRILHWSLGGALAGTGLLTPAVKALAAAPVGNAVVSAEGEKSLSLYNIHTHEKLNIVYRRNGHLIPTALDQINHILRDRRNGEATTMQPALLDLLHQLQTELEHDGIIEVISAYRSPDSNARMAKVSRGVAKHSLHTRGMAMDIRLPGVPLENLHKAALDLRGGGVGFYPRDRFVHLDIGRVRRWQQKA